jgi:photosystem II stability/assembly factor-like uncharacterized protein
VISISFELLFLFVIKYPRMKKEFLSASLLFFSLLVYTQNDPTFFKTLAPNDASTPEWAKMMYADNPNIYQVEDAFRDYYRDHPFKKTIHTQNYKHWRWRIETLIDADGFIVQKDRSSEDIESRRLKERLKQRQSMDHSRASSPDWHCIGPFETYFSNDNEAVSWHKNVYSIDQSASNPDVLICGTEAGGIYKTVDRGLNWTLASKNEVFVGGNEAVKIHPTNPDFFLVASNSRIYRSTDGGNSWIEVHYMNGSGYEFRFDPSDLNTIYCVGSKGLFKSTNAGDSWSQIFTEKCWDIDFHPTNSDIIYLLKSNPTEIRSELFRSDDGGTNWTLKDNNYYEAEDPANAIESGAKIALSPAAPDYVYVCLIGASKADDNGWIGIYKSTDKGETWTNPAGQDGGPYGDINGSEPWNVAAYSSGYHQGFFNFDLEVSDVDANKLWIATIRLTESSDGGATFTSIGAANSNRLSNIHADVQYLEVNGADIWVASDGGINYSTDELLSHESRKRGIQASHFWGFNTGWNQDTYTGGRYHDGTIGWFENYPDGTVFNIGGVEEPSGYVHPVEGRKMYYRTHYSSANTSVKTIPDDISGTTISHSSLPLYPNESYYTSASSAINFDHRYADHLFIGRDNILYKSVDGGSNFNALYTFPAGLVYEFEQSRDDYDVIYLVFRPDGQSNRVIYKSSDGGNTFTETALVPGSRSKIEITLNPKDSDDIWVGLGSGANGQKVYRSIDGGTNWTNMTTANLNDESIQDIKYQGGSNDLVYVASYNSVFYYDAINEDWIEYGEGLPLVAKSLKLNPFYRDGELRLGSKGRGVFAGTMADTLFDPVAQAITYKDTVYCKMDTVFFDCYSMLKHQGASWEWSFYPAPLYVEGSDLRNPKVVFGESGSYDVSLIVTNASNVSDTNYIPEMVYVTDRCQPDSIPGKMLRMQDDNDYAQIPNLGLMQTDTLSITAWVKPNGIQDDYTGIVMNDGNAAGFNFANGNNTLRYHWPGGQWWWNSGLIVEANKWSHVAMVATENAMKLYVNGEEAIHNIDLDPVDLGSLKIGSYQGWSSRNMRGSIDEVCIWTRALTKEEIQDLRHLTKEDTLQDPDFLAYYQFNEIPENPAFDKTGHGFDAILMNGADRINSDVPLGGGQSERLSLHDGGWYEFQNVGLKVKFPVSGNYPDGDWVVTRINVLPDVQPPLNNMYLDYYWIINNYGLNSSFSEPDSLWLYHLGHVYTSDETNYYLFGRSANGFGANWNLLKEHDDLIEGVNSAMLFTSGSQLINEMQLLLQYDSRESDIIWNGTEWRGGSGPSDSPGSNDQDKNVFVYPGYPATLYVNANVKSVYLLENAVLNVPDGINLTVE